MSASCRWCTRPAQRTIAVDAGGDTPQRMALCDHHLLAVQRARSGGPEAERHQRLLAEMEAWQRTFREPAPFGSMLG